MRNNFKKITKSSININKLQAKHFSNIHEVYVGLGSNLGNRFENFKKCIKMMRDKSIGKIVKTSQLYENPCVDSSNQILTKENKFVNAVIKIKTSLSPSELLLKFKEIESEFGRKSKLNYYDAREIDIDILLYNNEIIQTQLENYELSIPHLRMSDRLFVLKPLLDIDENMEYYDRRYSKVRKVKDILYQLLKEKYNTRVNIDEFNLYDNLVNMKKSPNFENLNKSNQLKTLLMGVINCTPDSFSGGLMQSNSKSEIENIIQMITKHKDNIDIIDIGGESTRPGSRLVNTTEELDRIAEVVRRIRESNDLKDKVISIDTRKSQVAKEALKLGANIINDVSGGLFDPDILKVIADSNSSFVINHSRAPPDIMQNKEFTNYSRECYIDVSQELQMQIENIKLNHEILDWNIIIDPGIGFSKLKVHNLNIINNLDKFKMYFPNLLLVGYSRKKFIQEILKVDAKSTVVGNIAIANTSIIKGANILRVHDYDEIHQTIAISEAILNN